MFALDSPAISEGVAAWKIWQATLAAHLTEALLNQAFHRQAFLPLIAGEADGFEALLVEALRPQLVVLGSFPDGTGSDERTPDFSARHG